MVPGSLPLTGERTVPGVATENYWFRRHEAAYEFVAPLVAGATVLEVGCGEGYGTSLLAGTARTVVGLDYDSPTVTHAAGTYPRVRFACANLAALPVRDRAVDAVVSLQVIEHVWDHPQFVRECLRVLRPGGLLLVSTPNRLTFSPGLDTPLNPFHVREFTATELVDLLTDGGFEPLALHGLHAGSQLAELDDRYSGSFVQAQLIAAPEQWSSQLRRDVTSVTTADFRIIDARVEDVAVALDLVVLVRRPR